MLELKNISLEKEGKKILDRIDLKLEEKKFYVMTGPNGGGKSSLAKVIMGIETSQKGQIFWNKEEIGQKSIDARSKMGIGFSFQQPIKFKGIKIKRLLELASKNKKLRGCGVLRQVGLCPREYLEREVDSSLSGGELKRIEIASVLLQRPKLAIFDEPEAGIDLWSFNNLIEVFKDLQKNYAGTILVISHQEKIMEMADEILLIKNGRLEIVEKNKIANLVIKKKCDSKGGCI
ncbi:MAG: ATP-binding cassette domain-containing protein [Candidatus Shapirobacteria bacterium]|jgi:Fe-S cluster assembly ATP-binding protein|nr:ATP-binding cassette domain-containing protein [Candidatus Shapirobacteria bacterium]